MQLTDQRVDRLTGLLRGFLNDLLIGLDVDCCIDFRRYGKEGRLTVTDHSMNFSRTYDANSSIATYRRSTDFDSLDNIYVGGLPDGAMVRKKKLLVIFSSC